MDIDARIQLTADEEERLGKILRCDRRELPDALQPYASAALEEYVRMFLGERVYTRGSDIREYRLLLLIKHATNGAIPDDDYVSGLFQTSTSQSRSLARSVLSKFQYELETGIQATVRAAVERARREQDADVWTTIIRSGNVVAAVNREIEVLDGALPLVTRTPGTAARYELKRSTYLRLCQQFGVQVQDDDD